MTVCADTTYNGGTDVFSNALLTVCADTTYNGGTDVFISAIGVQIADLEGNGRLGCTVFEDFDGHGVQDPGEPGEPGVGVLVTDRQGQEHPVTTNHDGDCSLSLPADPRRPTSAPPRCHPPPC